MRPSNNLPIPPKYTSFWATICDTPIFYPSLPEYNPPFKHPYATESTLRPKYTPILNIYMRPCQNLPLPPRIAYGSWSPFFTNICDTPIIHPPFQNIPPSISSGAPRIYPIFQEYTPIFYNYMRRSQNLCRPPRIYPPPRYICDLSRIYQSLQNIPPSSPLCDTPIIYPWPPSRNIPSPLNIYMRHSRNPPLFQNIPLKYSN